MQQIKEPLSTFKMKDLGELHYCLGGNVDKNSTFIYVNVSTMNNCLTSIYIYIYIYMGYIRS